jgi:hypothetical protein
LILSGIDILEKIFIPLVATFSGAWLAFRYQRSIEKNRDKRAVVQNLMMYRNVGADELDWIKSMNVIDVVFHNNEAVRQLYDQYLEWVRTTEKFKTGNHVRVYYEMLYKMAQDCGYTQITQYDIQKNVYSPNALQIHYPQSVSESFHHLGAPTQELAVLLEEIYHLGLA